jgi:ABC-type transport system involved in multi-copper enzyme maturation permease subunit
MFKPALKQFNRVKENDVYFMPILFRQFGAITKNTLLEAFRNKLFYGVLFFALIALASTGVFGALSLHQEERVFNDVVLFAAVVFLAGLTIYQGIRTIHREIETRTIFTVLSKPVSRSSFVFGKYIGSLVAIFAALLVILGLKVGALYLVGFEVVPQLFAAYYGAMLQLAIVLALTILFSTFSSPILSALFAGGIFIAGSLTPQLREAIGYFAEEGNPARYVAEAALFVLPDFDKLNLSFELTHRIPVPADYLITATGYAATYVAILLVVGCVIFARRDFS